MKKRFLVFAGYDYDNAYGWGDFREACTTLEEAKQAGARAVQKGQGPQQEWYQVVDLETEEVVYTEDGPE